MRAFTVSLAVFSMLAGSAAVFADPIPYPDVGSVAPTETLIATAAGSVDTYFYGFSAVDVDYVEILDLTRGTNTGFMLDNQTSATGEEGTPLAVNAGDVLAVDLENTTQSDIIFSTDPSLSTDGVNHGYITSYSSSTDGPLGSSGVPSGVYVGMEDLDAALTTDYDYNDETIVLTDVAFSAGPVPDVISAGQAPEPGSIALVGTGILAAASLVRRRLRAR
jgi:hypothetical protein